MTPKQTELAQAMRAAVRDGAWEWTGPASMRYTEANLPTPQYARDNRWWDPETYDRHVMMKLVPGRGKWHVLVRVVATPWTGASESEVTMKRALEVVSAPADSFTR